MDLLKNLSTYMQDFMEVLDFTIKEIENELDQQEVDTDNFQGIQDMGLSQPAKDFDFMLDSPSVKNLKKLLGQKRFLLEKRDLLPRIRETINNLEFQFRKEESAKSLIAEYNSKLDRNSNQDIDKEFIRIEKDDCVFYGQVNQQNQKHGIGTSLFENGFCYQGMYENDQMMGMGISLDPNLIKYVGEHRNGKRHGRGILYLPDGREYEGNWRENRMHGKGHERLPNGMSYMVFTNNGNRIDFLTEGKVQSSGAVISKGPTNQPSYDAMNASGPSKDQYYVNRQ